MKTDEAQDLVTLNVAQQSDFGSLKRALAKCSASGIYLYQVLDSLYALNGHHVKEVNDSFDGGIYAQDLIIPYVKTVDAWADDEHYVHFR